MKKRTLFFGIAGFILALVGILFKIMHLSGASVMLVIGTLILIFGFLLSFLLERLSISIKTTSRIGNILAFLAAVLILFGIVAKMMHYPGALQSFVAGGLLFVIHYIFYSFRSDSRKFELRSDRQLASILFTDIAGYTSMMGENEARALKILEQNRKIQKSMIKSFGGRLLKELGDGTLSVFFTASDAVLCAIEIMNKVKQDGSYNLRMGIHIGEIVFTEKDVFGDGVNIASRIMSQAKEGEICLSEAVYLNIKNKENFKAEALGDIELKNVAGKMRLFKIESTAI
ncbi:MAG TPA: adenylate/guanylate cyclase domain-containing protein [Cyclobacteriaceae bacterium]|nr:adenylate/guanylate cyclase domain-containing protein [Cyclobacteriaceae bacterium]